MISVKTKAHIGSDGMLTIEVPKPLRETDVEVILVIQPTPEERGWPPGFFEATAGAWQGEPLKREPQGEYEQRVEPA